MVTLTVIDHSFEQYDGEHGLAGLESALGLTASGDISQRVDSIVADLANRVVEWEKMRAAELLRDHALTGAIFCALERPDYYLTVHNGLATIGDEGVTLPNCWWAHLVIRLNKCGLYERLWDQAIRESTARSAQGVMKEERIASAANAAAASHAGHRSNKQKARDWYAAHKPMTKNDAAQRIKDEKIVHASFRTIRDYLIGQ